MVENCCHGFTVDALCDLMGRLACPCALTGSSACSAPLAEVEGLC